MPSTKVPRDQLPELGDWDGPIHGELGVLRSEGDKVVCHACGRAFRLLGSHVWQAHGISAAAYKAIFGLNALTGLAGAETRELLRQHAGRVLAGHAGSEAGRERFRAMTPEARSALSRGRRWRLEGRRDPRNRQLRQAAGARAVQKVRDLVAAGAWRSRPFPDPRAANRKGNARRSALLQDPDYRARFSRRLSAAKGGRAPLTCVVCEAQFAPPPYRKTCSRECERARRQEVSRSRPRDRDRIREAARRRGGQAAAYEATLARLRALEPAAFERLPSRDRELVRRYYGLDDGRPRTQRELREHSGLDGRRVYGIVADAVAQLLEGTPFGAPAVEATGVSGATL